MKKPTAGALKVLSGVEPLSPPGDYLSLSRSLSLRSRAPSVGSCRMPRHWSSILTSIVAYGSAIFTLGRPGPGSQYASSPLK